MEILLRDDSIGVMTLPWSHKQLTGQEQGRGSQTLRGEHSRGGGALLWLKPAPKNLAWLVRLQLRSAGWALMLWLSQPSPPQLAWPRRMLAETMVWAAGSACNITLMSSASLEPPPWNPSRKAILQGDVSPTFLPNIVLPQSKPHNGEPTRGFVIA